MPLATFIIFSCLIFKHSFHVTDYLSHSTKRLGHKKNNKSLMAAIPKGKRSDPYTFSMKTTFRITSSFCYIQIGTLSCLWWNTYNAVHTVIQRENNMYVNSTFFQVYLSSHHINLFDYSNDLSWKSYSI